MSLNSKRVESFAELFHHYYTALASNFGAPDHQPEWRELDHNQRKRLIAATRLALIEAGSRTNTQAIGAGFVNQGTEGRECGC